MSGVHNDYNQQENHPRIRIGNWVEERALMELTGTSRGSKNVEKNNTATRITGPVLMPTDYTTTTLRTHESVLNATSGPKFMQSAQPAHRSDRRESDRLLRARQILQEQQRAEEEKKQEELRDAGFGAKPPSNRKRALASTKTLEESARDNPLHGQPITFHTHHLATGGVLGVTPTESGVHTFSKSTYFSKPIAERHEHIDK
jgi:hypothetical protein